MLCATPTYGRPAYAVLEGVVELILVNTRHVKMVPGRKTDVRDCEWLAQLLECGLLRGSFVLAAGAGATEARCVVTDIMGKTGRDATRAVRDVDGALSYGALPEVETSSSARRRSSTRRSVR